MAQILDHFPGILCEDDEKLKSAAFRIRAEIMRLAHQSDEIDREMESRRLNKQVRIVCPWCSGKGYTEDQDGYIHDCDVCKKTGKIMADPA